MTRKTNRRDFVTTSGTAVAAALIGTLGERLQAENRTVLAGSALSGRKINHSVCKWCYGNIPLEDLCFAGSEFGLQSVEIISPADKPTLDKYGMTCAMAVNPTTTAGDGHQVGGIGRGWNRREYHDVLVDTYQQYTRDAANAGFKNVICFSGNRDGLDDETGMKNCADGVRRLMPLCEKLGVTLSMELLNSKHDHKDYMADHTAWGIELCKLVGSERFKLLFDIYHMQIMEGDIIATIREYHSFFSHYHTGGVPGRAEIDDTQELNYPAIMRAILDTGYEGYIGQEFIPRRPDKIASLRQGVEICTV
jgi:hydroxypyruvate isomerase